MLQISKCEKYECYISNKCKKSIFLPSLKVRKLFSIGKYQYQKHSLGVKKRFYTILKKWPTKRQSVEIGLYINYKNWVLEVNVKWLGKKGPIVGFA